MSAFGGKADMACRGSPLSRLLLGVKRTSLIAAHMSGYDPKRTLVLSPQKNTKALFFVGLGNDDHLILANIECHQIRTEGERSRILLARLALDVGDCWRRIIWRA